MPGYLKGRNGAVAEVFRMDFCNRILTTENRSVSENEAWQAFSLWPLRWKVSCY